jgi:hypothetical protein
VKSPPTIAEVLGPRAWKIVSLIPNLDLRAKVIAAVETCAAALAVIDDVDLSPHELADLETPNVAAWNALAPDVRNVLLAVRAASETLKQIFPPRSSFSPVDTFQSGEIELDAIVRGSSMESDEAQLGESINTLATVLLGDIIALGGKLRNPQVAGDRWFLLGELHQFIGGCTQCLDAIIATVVGTLTTDNLDDVLPRYVSETTRAVKLRSLMVDLSRDIDRYNSAISVAAGIELEILKNGLTERIGELAISPIYKTLRPQDKRAIILFRIALNRWEKSGKDETVLRHELEGFSKFLELMRELTFRDQLADNDRRSLLTAYEVLESGVDVPMVKPYLERSYGRSSMVDELTRNMRSGNEPPRDVLLNAVRAALNGR